MLRFESGIFDSIEAIYNDKWGKCSNHDHYDQGTMAIYNDKWGRFLGHDHCDRGMMAIITLSGVDVWVTISTIA